VALGFGHDSSCKDGIRSPQIREAMPGLDGPFPPLLRWNGAVSKRLDGKRRFFAVHANVIASGLRKIEFRLHSRMG
jgi:hypothetical protein